MEWKILIRQIKYISLSECTIGFLYDFYVNPKNADVVLIIKQGASTVGWLNIDVATNCMYESDVKEALEESLGMCINESDLTNFRKLESLYKLRWWLAVDLEKGIFVKDKPVPLSYVREKYIETRNILKKMGIGSYIIEIVSDLNNTRMGIMEQERLFWCDEREESTRKLYFQMSEGSYEHAKKVVMSEEGEWGNSVSTGDLTNHKKKLYLVGRCIVARTTVLPYESLSRILSKEVEDYEIIRLPNIGYTYPLNNIFEYTLYEGDVVLFFIESDCDMTDMLDLNIKLNNISEQILYTNMCLHTTYFGNKLISQQILKQILEDERKQHVQRGDVLHIGKKQYLTYNVEQYIAEYLCYLKNVINNKHIYGGGVIGAVVINANPFTLGHRYLCEYAAKKVDFLYVFVVEEDVSDFPLFVRKQLVEAGTADIGNLAVVSSGKLIISKVTFSDYFTKKDEGKEKIDVSKDVEFFSNYIAPACHITVRFVGEEPFDYVTRSYNEAMKEIFPTKGIQVIEIPRKKKNDNIISATRVRKYYKEKNWEQLKELLPDTTYQYLKTHTWEEIQQYRCTKTCKDLRLLEEYKIAKKALGWQKKLKKAMDKELNIVVWGIGEDAHIVDKKMNLSMYPFIEYCDKRAETEEVYFHGHKVIKPSEVEKEKIVFVSSSDYRKEIFENLKENGHNEKNIILIGNV